MKFSLSDNRGGFILILSLFFVLIFCMVTMAFFLLVMNEANAAKKDADSMRAFYLAEAGIRRGLYELRQGNSGDIYRTSLDGMGEYEVSVSGTTMTAKGYYPDYSSSSKSTRTIAVEFDIPTPPNFFSNAILAAGNVDLRGSYNITGDVVWGQSFSETGSPGVITGVESQDTTIYPLPHLNFQELRNIALTQIKPDGNNNIYTAEDVRNGKPWPTSFWYDEANGIPNIVYVETDLFIRGNVGDIGGFYAVVGDVLTDAEAETEDATLSGNVSLDGCIYTLGNFRVNGGGSAPINIDGGIWAGNEARTNGGVNITYNGTYMNALQNLDIDYELQVISWKESPGN